MNNEFDVANRFESFHFQYYFLPITSPFRLLILNHLDPISFIVSML